RIEQISWHPKADLIYFTAGNKGTTSIYCVGVNADDVEHVEGEDCHLLEYVINKAGDKICFISTNTTNLTEIFLHDLSSKKIRQITNNSGSLLQHCELQEATTFWFKSFDDMQIQGWLIKPAQFNPAQKYPV